MAAKTPTGTPLRAVVGNVELHIFSFLDIDDNDTYASGLDNVVGWWANGQDVPGTQSASGIDVGTSANGTFKFYTAENNREAKLFVLTGQLE